MKRLVLAAAMAALITPPLAAQDSAGVRRITLAEAVDLSLRSQPAMVQARQNLRTAAAGERVAWGAFLPTVTLSGGSSGSGSDATRFDQQSGRLLPVGVSYSDNVGISANLNLFTGFQRGANRRAAQATSDLREASVLQQEYATALSTKQAFFQALAAAELVGVQEAQLRRSDEQLKLTTERLRLGATTRSDSLRARVDYGNSQLALINARNSLRTAQANLARAVQLPGLVAPAPDSALEVRLGSLDTAQLRRDALAAAPTIRQAESSVRNSRAQLSSSRAAWMPTLSANASNRWARTDPRFSGGAGFLRNWSLGIQLSYPLFNGFQRESNITTADANVVSAEASLRDARLALDANLTTQLAALDAAAASIDVSVVSVAAAEEDLRMQRERYRLGAVTILEVLTSQASLEQAQVNLVQARYNYLVAKAQIEALVGHSL